MTSYEFLDELPGKSYEASIKNKNTARADSQDLYDHAAVLIRNPMKWSKYPRQVASSSVVYNNIRGGTCAAYDPELGFQVAIRKRVLYIRYNPEAVSPIRVAYQQGYDKGVFNTIKKFHPLVVALHVGYLEIKNDN